MFQIQYNNHMSSSKEADQLRVRVSTDSGTCDQNLPNQIVQLNCNTVWSLLHILLLVGFPIHFEFFCFFISDGFSGNKGHGGLEPRYTCRICGKVFNRAGL